MICFQNLTDITHEKLENYFLILSTIEKNLVEAKTIQAEIVNVRRQRKRRFKSEFTLYQTLSLFPPRSISQTLEMIFWSRILNVFI